MYEPRSTRTVVLCIVTYILCTILHYLYFLIDSTLELRACSNVDLEMPTDVICRSNTRYEYGSLLLVKNFFGLEISHYTVTVLHCGN